MTLRDLEIFKIIESKVDDQSICTILTKAIVQEYKDLNIPEVLKPNRSRLRILASRIGTLFYRYSDEEEAYIKEKLGEIKRAIRKIKYKRPTIQERIILFNKLDNDNEKIKNLQFDLCELLGWNCESRVLELLVKNAETDYFISNEGLYFYNHELTKSIIPWRRLNLSRKLQDFCFFDAYYISKGVKINSDEKISAIKKDLTVTLEDIDETIIELFFCIISDTILPTLEALRKIDPTGYHNMPLELSKLLKWRPEYSVGKGSNNMTLTSGHYAKLIKLKNKVEGGYINDTKKDIVAAYDLDDNNIRSALAKTKLEAAYLKNSKQLNGLKMLIKDQPNEEELLKELEEILSDPS